MAVIWNKFKMSLAENGVLNLFGINICSTE